MKRKPRLVPRCWGSTEFVPVTPREVPQNWRKLKAFGMPRTASMDAPTPHGSEHTWTRQQRGLYRHVRTQLQRVRDRKRAPTPIIGMAFMYHSPDALNYRDPSLTLSIVKTLPAHARAFFLRGMAMHSTR